MADKRSRGAALVVGVGPGLGASLCRALAVERFAVVGASRSLSADSKLAQAVSDAIAGFEARAVDAADAARVAAMIDGIERMHGPLRVLIYNASAFQMGSFEDLAPEAFEATWRVTCLGAMIVGQAALPRMAAQGGGVAIFTGATASMRGGAAFAAFASAKFALRGLVQSLSREYWPKGVHVAHTIIDGIIADREGALHPDDIAAAYVGLINQPRSAWTQELDLRPNLEKF